MLYRIIATILVVLVVIGLASLADQGPSSTPTSSGSPASSEFGSDAVNSMRQ